MMPVLLSKLLVRLIVVRKEDGLLVMNLAVFRHVA